MKVGGKNKTRNKLWLARKRRGLRQKQVAYLLNHHTVDQVSRYEKGLRTPTLEIALMLEIIYRMPLRLIFDELYQELQEKIQRDIQSSPSLQHLLEGIEKENLAEFCTYAEYLRIPSVSMADSSRVRDHITRLAKKLAYL